MHTGERFNEDPSSSAEERPHLLPVQLLELVLERRDERLRRVVVHLRQRACERAVDARRGLREAYERLQCVPQGPQGNRYAAA